MDRKHSNFYFPKQMNRHKSCSVEVSSNYGEVSRLAFLGSEANGKKHATDPHGLLHLHNVKSNFDLLVCSVIKGRIFIDRRQL